MTTFAETGPQHPVTESIRVDKVNPRARLGKNIRAILVVIIAVIMLMPVFVMAMTAFKSRADVVAVPPKLIFEPTLEGFVFLLTERSQLSGQALEDAKANEDELGLLARVALQNGQYTTVPVETCTQGVRRVDVAELYDEEEYRPRVRHVVGKPMFLY